MSFYKVWEEIDFDGLTRRIEAVNAADVERTLGKEQLSIDDLPVLVSEAASAYLETMAVRAKSLTKERFGNTIQLYAPLYLSNECANSCLYCGFSARNKDIRRRTLTMGEIETELTCIAKMGIKHVLLVTGEFPAKAGLDYIAEAVELCAKYAAYTAIEIYPLDEDGYRTLVNAGASGLTIYQETYNAPRYAELHPRGRKKDMQWRLEAPDRGAAAGMRTVGVGALLGLSDPRTDAVFTGIHADYLMKKYWRTAVTVSFPRLRAAEGCAVQPLDADDKLYVQLMMAIRLTLPDAGFVVSTRERAELRDNIVGLAPTQMSAASATEPGGYSSHDESTAQFQVEDTRSVEEFSRMLMSKGYEPVTKDWSRELSGL